MSHEGKMGRGEIWWKYRDADGNLPKEITDDPVKMADVKYYLENKDSETPKETKGSSKRSKK